LATTELFVLQSCQAASSFSNRQKGAQRFAAEEKNGVCKPTEK
jgi:hypothetical protein